jgi:hypothetical protein
MLKQLKHYGLMGLTICFAKVLVAQDIVADISRINNAYLTNKRFSMDIETSSFDMTDTIHAFEILNGFARKDGELMHQKLGTIETIRSVDMTLTLNHEKRMMILTKNDQNTIQFSASMAESIQSVVNKSNRVKFSQVSSQLGKYTLLFSAGGNQKLEFTFNTQTFLLDEIVFYQTVSDATFYDQPAKPEKKNIKYVVRFLNIDVNPVFRPNEFTSWSYIYREGNQFKALSKYSDYSINNQLTAN